MWINLDESEEMILNIIGESLVDATSLDFFPLFVVYAKGCTKITRSQQAFVHMYLCNYIAYVECGTIENHLH